jgi:hypothetical protein
MVIARINCAVLIRNDSIWKEIKPLTPTLPPLGGRE